MWLEAVDLLYSDFLARPGAPVRFLCLPVRQDGIQLPPAESFHLPDCAKINRWSRIGFRRKLAPFGWCLGGSTATAETSMKNKERVTRRTFLSGAASTSLGITIVPASVLATPAPSDRLNIGHIGLGGRGRRFLSARLPIWTRRLFLLGEPGRSRGPVHGGRPLSTALCDVDSSRLDMSATMVGGKPRLFSRTSDDCSS